MAGMIHRVLGTIKSAWWFGAWCLFEAKAFANVYNNFINHAFPNKQMCLTVYAVRQYDTCSFINCNRYSLKQVFYYQSFCKFCRVFFYCDMYYYSGHQSKWCPLYIQVLNWVITMPADALAPEGARSSAGMVLTTKWNTFHSHDFECIMDNDRWDLKKSASTTSVKS